MKDLAPGQSKQAAILAGLQVLVPELMSREFEREGGQVLRVRLGPVDAGYVPAIVQTAIRTSPCAPMLLASQGLPIAATAKPLSEYIKKPGHREGHYWRIPATSGRRVVPCVQFDANYWKSRLRDAFQVPLGEQAQSSVSIFGRQARVHRLLADHETSEYFVRVEARGRAVEQWQPRPGDPDNHFLDCSVGNLVAASLLGIHLPAAELPAPPRPAAPRQAQGHRHQPLMEHAMTEAESRKREAESSRQQAENSPPHPLRRAPQAPGEKARPAQGEQEPAFPSRRRNPFPLSEMRKHQAHALLRPPADCRPRRRP